MVNRQTSVQTPHLDLGLQDTSSTDHPAVPDVVVRRLPLYVRSLRAMSDLGIASVSSEGLAEAIGVTAAQVRRDLSYFGRFGKQGKGYETAYLADAFAHFLKLDRQWPVALVGYGNLGRAIVGYRGLIPSSFSIVAIFDQAAGIQEPNDEEQPIYSDEQIGDVISQLGIRIGIIAVPASEAQKVADQMVDAGVEAILNYAPVVLRVPDSVTVREIDPISSLQSMTYYLPD